MSQFEEAKNKELGELENDSSASSEWARHRLPIEVKVIVKLTCIVGPYKDHVFTIKPKSVGYCERKWSVEGVSHHWSVGARRHHLKRCLLEQGSWGFLLPRKGGVDGDHWLRSSFCAAASWSTEIWTVQTTAMSTGRLFGLSVMNRELVEDDITLKTGDVLHVGQSELKISIQKV